MTNDGRQIYVSPTFETGEEVDAALLLGRSSIQEAPKNAIPYARQDGAWVPSESGSGNSYIITSKTIYVETPSNGGSDITGDGLAVGTAYATLQKALDSLLGVSILETATVTIQLGAGDFVFDDVTMFTHPYGKHIKIYGTVSANNITGVVQADFTNPVSPVAGTRGAFDLYNTAGMLSTSTDANTRTAARAQDTLDNETLLKTVYLTTVSVSTGSTAIAFITDCLDIGDILFYGTLTFNTCGVRITRSIATVGVPSLYIVNRAIVVANKVIVCGSNSDSIQVDLESSVNIVTAFIQGSFAYGISSYNGEITLSSARITGCAYSGILLSSNSALEFSRSSSGEKHLDVTGNGENGITIDTNSSFNWGFVGATSNEISAKGNFTNQISISDGSKFYISSDSIALTIQANSTYPGLIADTDSNAIIDGSVEINSGIYSIQALNSACVHIAGAMTFTNPVDNILHSSYAGTISLNGVLTSAQGLGIVGVSALTGGKILDTSDSLYDLSLLEENADKFSPPFGSTLADGSSILGLPVGTGGITIGEDEVKLGGTTAPTVDALAGTGTRMVTASSTGQLASQAIIDDASELSYVPAGTDAVTTTVQGKLRETVSVWDYIPNGFDTEDTDCSVYIQAAIDANPGRSIYIPAGKYLISTTLTISTHHTILTGEMDGRVWYGSAGTVIICNEAIDAIHFLNPSPSDSMSGCGITKINITRTTHVATGSGLKVTRVGGFVADNISVSEYFTCIDLIGVMSSTFSRIDCQNAVYFTGAVGSSMVKIRGIYPLTSSEGIGWINTFNQFKLISGIGLTDHGLHILSGDELRFSNGYIGGMKENGILMEMQHTEAGMYGVNFNQVMLDGGLTDITQTKYGLSVLDNGIINNDSVAPLAGLSFTACTFGQLGDGALINIPESLTILFNGCGFYNIARDALQCGPTTGSFTITGCQFANIGYDYLIDSYSSIKSSNAKSLSIVGCAFLRNFDTARTIALEGLIENVNIQNNVFTSYGTGAFTPLYFASGTVVYKQIYGSNASNSTDTGILGITFQNEANPDTKALDWYKETYSTSACAVAFGGASVGVTYTNREISYTRIGDRVLFDCSIQLSSKGSSTGVMTIEGLPFAVHANSPSTATVRLTSMAASIGDTSLTSSLVGTTVKIEKMASGSIVQLTDTDFADTSAIIVSGQYRVA